MYSSFSPSSFSSSEYYYYYFTSCKFGGVSLKSERQQVFSGFLDSSKYSGRFINIVVCMVSIPSLISNSSILFAKPLGTVPSAPITTGITVTLMCYMLLLLPESFFILALADSLSMGAEWQQISTILQDSSQYSGRLRQFCSFNGLNSSSDFQPLYNTKKMILDASLL